ncbi:ATP-dependent acyl-CoA ligase [Pimelobacter simplex]|uniref:ATP-dependent acyl-CoA ligase n=1 Tax=Nocardioides simplex TaxID=2045 RepID=A0A7J5DY51_NOCSI|nr:AMP-binding protein [Pimelobacter simplex]KAB2810910.1 ATP-dependent acyl-CoA ligase [Pimelobacter simplex]
MNASWLTSDAAVLPHALRRRAAQHPERTLVVFEDGARWTYEQTLRESERVALALRRLGVGKGDRVLSWLPTGPDALRVWFGVNLLGAVLVPLNTAYRGGLLEHSVALSGARVAVVHAGLADRLDAVERAELTDVVVVGDEAAIDGVRTHAASVLDAAAVSEDERWPQVMPWDPYAVVLTSGTTGPSKGVVCSYAQLSACADAAFADSFGADDRYLVTLPLFHAGGTIGVNAAVVLGGSVALSSGFRTGEFWELVRATEPTHVTLLGVMATFLSKQEPSPADRAHPLRRVFMIPLSDAAAFSARFGVDVVAMYNMTEVSIPIISAPNPAADGTSGRVRAGMEARLVDEHDIEVPEGAVGELVVRGTAPWTIATEYLGRPEATAAAWRNGWFHTGDAFRRVDGEYFFVDRMGDTIRRRGENISSFEVENEIVAHPSVAEVAIVATPSPDGEDEVLAVIAPAPGRSVDVAELIEFIRPRMAHFMVPRFYRLLDELPKTPTSKVQKHALREAGVTADTIDREDLGVRIRQEHIGADRQARR